MLSDNAWNVLKQLLLEHGVYSKRCLRNTLEGMLFRMRTGSPWRDLPSEFGHWNSIFSRFNAWSKKGILTSLFSSFSALNDPEWLFIDASIVPVHQSGMGAQSKEYEAIGKSVGGNTTKLHLAVDSNGFPVHFELSGGQVHDIVHADSLVESSPTAAVVTADKGYDSQSLRELIVAKGASANIPRKANSKVGNEEMDWCLYKYRHLVENAFQKIKAHRGIATRFDKLKRNFASTVALALVIMWLPMHVD
jgi:transposase